jgi:hypothetical protein
MKKRGVKLTLQEHTMLILELVEFERVSTVLHNLDVSGVSFVASATLATLRSDTSRSTVIAPQHRLTMSQQVEEAETHRFR